MRVHVLFFVAAALFVVAGILPVVRGGSANVVFLSSAVVWLVLGLASRKHARASKVGKGEPGV